MNMEQEKILERIGHPETREVVLFVADRSGTYCYPASQRQAFKTRQKQVLLYQSSLSI